MNDLEKKFILAFSRLPEIGPARFRKIRKHFKNFANAWEAGANDFASIAGINESLAKKISSAKKDISPNEELDNLNKLEIDFVTAEDEAYPDLLAEASSAPYLLFFKGDLSLLASKQVGVVGSRTPTQYGKIATEKIVSDLSRAGLTITSGMAHGIDSIAHKAALAQNGKTIAVLGAGIAQAAINVQAKRIIHEIVSSGGAVISEYHPLARATKFTFPARNRIISGLSLGVLVAEAAEKSGALITARYALEEGREIFAVPGSIFSEKSAGTHGLIRQGAQLTAGAKDILEAFNFAADEFHEKNSPEPTFNDEAEKKIYAKLSFEPLHIDKISKSCSLDSQLVAAKLSVLELSGIVKNVGGGMFIRC